MNRRSALKLLGGVTLAAAAPWVRAAERSLPHVVVVGAGWGGLGAARELAKSGQVRVTLVEANERFMSCPMSVSYLTGEVPLERIMVSYERVAALGVAMRRDRVVGLDRSARRLSLASGEQLAYDFLVLSPGIDYDWSALPGANAEAFPVGFRAFEHQKLKERWDRFLAQGGGTYVISVPKPPYRCPPAPYERAAMFATQMKRQGIKGKIVILDANPNPVPPPIAKPILNTFAQRFAELIERHAEVSIQQVDVANRILETSAGKISFADANLIPAMRAPDWIREAGLGERFAAVQLPTFRAQADERIYLIGDAIGTPLPKSGHVAFGSGQQAAFALLAQIAGKPVVPAAGETVSLPAGICWAKMGGNTAIGIHVNASMTIGEAPKLQFQVDPEPTAASYQASWQWAENQWAAMLG